MQATTAREALTPEGARVTLRDAADALTQAVSGEAPSDGMESVSSAFGSPWSLFDLVDYLCAYNQNQRLSACDVGYGVCLRNVNPTPLRPNDGCGGTGATPGRDCVQPVSPGDGGSACFMEHALCKLDVYENPGFGCAPVSGGLEPPQSQTPLN